MNLKQYIRDILKEYISVFKARFAKTTGDKNVNFKVKTPSSDNDATNLKFLSDYYSPKTHNHNSTYAPKTHQHTVSQVNGLSSRLYNLETTRAYTSNVLGHSYYWIDTTSREYTTTWGDGYITPYIYGTSKTRFVEFNFHILGRNDSTSWGGLKMQLFISINGGDWIDVGIDHHGGNVMQNGSTAISSHHNQYRINFDSSGMSSVRFKFRHASFDGTVYINQGGVSGVFFSNFMAKEYRAK